MKFETKCAEETPDNICIDSELLYFAFVAFSLITIRY
jgi:hypothetical protein